jgi:hypothetical protein
VRYDIYAIRRQRVKHLAHRTITEVDLFLVRKLNSHSVQFIIYFSVVMLYFGCYLDCLKVVVRNCGKYCTSYVVKKEQHHPHPES